jgi:hypothetical protein
MTFLASMAGSPSFWEQSSHALPGRENGSSHLTE